MCGICFGIFSCCSYAAREVWTAWSACDRLPTFRLGNSGNTSATPLLIDFARDGLPHCCELALSVCRFRDSLTGYTRRDATWMQLVQAPSTPYCLYPAGADHWQCRCQRICWQAALGLLRLFVRSWYDSAFLCVGVSCGYLADPEVGLVFVTSPTCNVCLVYFAVPGGGGVGSTVPVEGGVVFPPLRFLSMYTFA